MVNVRLAGEADTTGTSRKFAVTFFAASMVTLQVRAVPEHAPPPQAMKLLAAGMAVRMTLVLLM